jgi:hypothetical protein
MKGGRDILSEYGNDIPHPQAPRATSGGVTHAKPTTYSPPQGPTNINDPKSPGIHGDHHGMARCPVPGTGEGGHRGIGGTNLGNKGTQRG